MEQIPGDLIDAEYAESTMMNLPSVASPQTWVMTLSGDQVFRPDSHVS